MSEYKNTANFEDKLEALEALVAQMEEGKLSLDELLATYEKGVKLADSLKLDLERAQAKLSELKQGSVKPVDEA
ncbi:MAG: exodeoxyribonuclease VII small subunit [Eubacteriales bacterium]|jgi:exodeoxyribonuclease VII small subunit|nr:exodeoxyribonuclease VII small subunit [Eubacteriales bacterium]MDD3109258.1 exodeoxyribonuclease VII small subunit [Eubacteriales bacterium]MDD3573379.1 exodeoxyribonuclease VII small subunit [Eubacteriales bacterium]MDD4134918.1 exodeoxyribonuclease VII small subunit [Eubacteriales bacterium]NLO13911.1 exodeoxyribonuclease VII small subunit [Clostridiales bacterium]